MRIHLLTEHKDKVEEITNEDYKPHSRSCEQLPREGLVNQCVVGLLAEHTEKCEKEEKPVSTPHEDQLNLVLECEQVSSSPQYSAPVKTEMGGGHYKMEVRVASVVCEVFSNNKEDLKEKAAKIMLNKMDMLIGQDKLQSALDGDYTMWPPD